MGQEPNKPEGGFDLLPLVFFLTFVILMAGVGFSREKRPSDGIPLHPPMPRVSQDEKKPEVPVDAPAQDRAETAAPPEAYEPAEVVQKEKPPRKPREGLMDYGLNKPYPHVDAVPEDLWTGIEPGVFYEDYLEVLTRSLSGPKQKIEKDGTRVFATLDKNLDGMISEREYEPAVEFLALRSLKRRAEGFVADLDSDEDGGLSRKEFRAARRTSEDSVLDPLLRKEFHYLDRDRDKRISADELSQEIRRQFEYEKHASIGRPKVKIPTTCGFGEDLKLPEDTVVYAVGGYGNGLSLDFVIDQSGENAHLIDLVVNEPDYPVALILGQYEPTVWHIRRTPETKIVAVYLTGYHRQAASALESDVALKSSMYNDSGEGSCGYIPFWGEDKDNLDFLAIQIYGRRAEDYSAIARDGTAIAGGENFDRANLVHSRRNPPESYKLEGVPAAGRAGIDEALEKGFIRPVTTADQIAWVDKITDYAPDDPAAAEFLRRIEEDPSGQYMQMIWGEAYVVVRDDFTYPPGLHGGNAGVFIIPDGVKRPKGDPGHSAIYDFKTMRCYGGVRCM